MTRNQSFAAYTALRERNSVMARMAELRLQPSSSWRNREMQDLGVFLAEVDSMVAQHRAAS